MASGNTLVREAGRLLRPLGLTAAQFNVLNLLSAAPKGMRASELTRLLVVNASSTTHLLDRMEDRGLLRRANDKKDRRAWRIMLTPAGRSVHREAAASYYAAMGHLSDHLGKAPYALAIDLVAQFQAAAPLAVDEALCGTRRKAKPSKQKRGAR